MDLEGRMVRSRYERQSVSAGYDWLESVSSNETIGRRIFWHNLESGCRSGFSCEFLWGPTKHIGDSLLVLPGRTKNSALPYNDFRVSPVVVNNAVRRNKNGDMNESGRSLEVLFEACENAKVLTRLSQDDD